MSEKKAEHNFHTVTDLINVSCNRYGEDIAIKTPKSEMTYNELYYKSNKLAHYLSKYGVCDGDIVGIYMDRSIECVIAMISIWKLGAAYVPLDPNHPKERTEYIILNSKVRIILTKEFLAQQLGMYITQNISIDKAWSEIEKEPKESLFIGDAVNRLAYVIYTSGSTGKPKGVEIGQNSVVNLLKSAENKPGMNKSDRLMAITTITFDISALEIFLPLVAGATLFIADEETIKNGKKLGEDINRLGITIMQGTPTTWRFIIESGWKGYSSLKILCGGEVLSEKLADELLSRCSSLWNMYGPTETTIWSMVSKVTNAKRITLGSPVDNTVVQILNSKGESVKSGETGCLYIGGAGLFLGYANNPTLTCEKLIDYPCDTKNYRLYDTGDLVKVLEDGDIQYLERVDLQVKIRGFRIELGEIENAAETDPFITQAVAVVESIQDENKRIVLFFRPASGKEKSDDCRSGAILKRLRTKLPDYMLPSVCILVENLPLTPNRKVDRKALMSKITNSRVEETLLENLSDDLESKITKIWETLLFIDDIMPDDEFLDLGGHSLLITQLLNKIQVIFNVNISVMEFLTDGYTVSSMTNMIRKKQKEKI